MTNANDELFERITAYLDGDMSAEEKAVFEAEVETNEELRDLMMAATEAMEVVSRVTAPKPPEDFDHDVARVIRRRSRGRFFGSWRHSHYQGSWLFALISLAFLAAWMLLVTPERMDALLGPAPGSGTAPEDEWEMEFPDPIVPQEGTQTPAVPLPGAVPVDAAQDEEGDGSGAGHGVSAGSGRGGLQTGDELESDLRGVSGGGTAPPSGDGDAGSEGSADMRVSVDGRWGSGVDEVRTMAQPRLRGWVYRIETPLAGAELRTELVNRVGSARLEETATGFRIRLGLNEQVQMASRLQELGVVRREAHMADSTNAPTWLEVVSTQR